MPEKIKRRARTAAFPTSVFVNPNPLDAWMNAVLGAAERIVYIRVDPPGRTVLIITEEG